MVRGGGVMIAMGMRSKEGGNEEKATMIMTAITRMIKYFVQYDLTLIAPV